MRPPILHISLLVLGLLIAGAPVHAQGQSGTRGATNRAIEMGAILSSTALDPENLSAEQAAELRDLRREASSAATRIVRDDLGWQEAAGKFEALALRPEYAADYVSQQLIAAIALKGVLLEAPRSDASREAILREVTRLIENDSNDFVAMVEGVDAMRPGLDAAAARDLERAIVALYQEHTARGCVHCSPEAWDAQLREPDETGVSMYDRMPPSLRTRSKQQHERLGAARDRILDWAS